MHRNRPPLWIVLLCLGLLSAGAGAAGLIFRATGRSIPLIPLLVLLFILVSGILLAATAIRSLRMLPRPEACGQDNADRRFGRALSLGVLLGASFLFLLFFAHARTVRDVPQPVLFYERGKVLSVDQFEQIESPDAEGKPIGCQYVTVQVRTGAYKGGIYALKNYLSYLYGTPLKEGDAVTLSYTVDEQGPVEIFIQDLDRTVPLIIVVLLFFLVTVLVGGKVGAKSLMSLGFTILCFFSILVPELIGGAPTLPMILGMCAFVTVVTFVFLGGVTRKTLCAILGTILGVLFAALFGKLAGMLLRVDGFSTYTVDPSVEALLQLKHGQIAYDLPQIQIRDLLVGGILISSLGAVHDVAMSISSAMNELIAVNPGLTRRELFRSGMNIGRDMVGTMTNTLILSFVGGGLFTIIHLTSLNPTYRHFMCTPYLSVEIIRGVASSIGVVLGVPLSVILSMVIFGKPRHRAGASPLKTR